MTAVVSNDGQASAFSIDVVTRGHRFETVMLAVAAAGLLAGRGVVCGRLRRSRSAVVGPHDHRRVRPSGVVGLGRRTTRSGRGGRDCGTGSAGHPCGPRVSRWRGDHDDAGDRKELGSFHERQVPSRVACPAGAGTEDGASLRRRRTDLPERWPRWCLVISCWSNQAKSSRSTGRWCAGSRSLTSQRSPARRYLSSTSRVNASGAGRRTLARRSISGRRAAQRRAPTQASCGWWRRPSRPCTDRAAGRSLCPRGLLLAPGGCRRQRGSCPVSSSEPWPCWWWPRRVPAHPGRANRHHVGLSRCARRGVVVKGGGALEQLGRAGCCSWTRRHVDRWTAHAPRHDRGR